MKKQIITILIYILAPAIIIIGISIGVHKFIEWKSSDVFISEVVVIERRAAKEITVSVTDRPKTEMAIYSNIFNIGDIINVEYLRVGKVYKITKINSKPGADINEIASRISADPTMIQYEKKVEGRFPSDVGIFSPIVALPEVIQGQTYNLIKPLEYYEIKILAVEANYVTIPANAPTTIIGLSDFKVLSVENHVNGEKTNISVQTGSNSFTIVGTGQGVYIARIEFKNGDIINYIFK